MLIFCRTSHAKRRKNHVNQLDTLICHPFPSKKLCKLIGHSTAHKTSSKKLGKLIGERAKRRRKEYLVPLALAKTSSKPSDQHWSPGGNKYQTARNQWTISKINETADISQMHAQSMKINENLCKINENQLKNNANGWHINEKKENELNGNQWKTIALT